VGLTVGLALSVFWWVWWADRKMAQVRVSQLARKNAKTKAFYRAIGERWYPHRNEDGTISHYPA
jgi:hypothetical protein